jgi:uncharacterized lipoprotein YmbA
MEHPLIGNLDDQTEEQLSARINELNTKLGIAARTGNGHLCNQLRMAIETYQSKYRQKVQDNMAQHTNGTNFDNKINIK